MRKWILILSPLAVLFLIIFALRVFVQPRIENYALSYFINFARTELPVTIEAEKFEFEWISPKIKLTNAVIKPRPGKDFGFDELKVDQIAAHLDVIQIIGGRIFLSMFSIKGVHVTLNLDAFLEDKGPTKELPMEKIFSRLEQVPVYNLAISESDIDLFSPKNEISVSLKGLGARFANLSKRVVFELHTAESKVRWKKLETPFILKTAAKITPKTLEIASLDLQASGQSVNASGFISNLPRLPFEPLGSLKVVAHADGEPLKGLLSPEFKIPDLHGQLDLESQVDIRGFKIPQLNFHMKTTDVHVSKTEIGSLQTNGEFKNDVLTIQKASLAHSAGAVLLSDISVKVESETRPIAVTLQAKLGSEKIDVFQLLKQVGAGIVPLHLTVGGHFDCGGPLLPKPSLVCVGEIEGTNFDVRPDIDEDPVIASFERASAKGGVQINDEAVSYNATVKMGEDTGKSTGLINYDKGFQIQYDTPSVDLGLFRKIGGLAVEGRASASGSTSGDSHAATFEMHLKSDKFVFEDFNLGAVDTKAKYAKGVLTFDNLEGRLGESSYRGRIDALLNDHRVKVRGSSGQMNWEDLFYVFNRKFKPFTEITGNASFDVDLEGPFELGQLSYTLNVRTPKLVVGGESFHTGEFRIRSDRGNAHAEVAQLRKGSRLITATGSSKPNGDVDVTVKSDQLLLEESEYLSHIGSAISGAVNGQVRITGFVLQPSYAIESNINQLIIDDQELPPSTVNMRVSDKEWSGNVSLFSGQLVSDFHIPFTPQAPFHVKLKANDWNFAALASLIGGVTVINEYQTSLTGNLDLSSPKGGFWAATGEGAIQKFVLKRGDLGLQNPKPMKVVMHDGTMEFQQFRLEGDKSYFQLTGGRINRDQLRLKSEGKVNLRLLQIFVPPLEEMGGEAKLDVAVNGTVDKPEVLGSANLKDGFAKLRNFPHPLERVSAEVQFSHSKILFNEIRGSFAGGVVNGDGSMLIEGFKNLPTNIRAHAEGVSLNVPEKVRSNGNLDLNFNGSWFPFTLSGHYRVTGGIFEKEFEEDSGIQRIQQSSYLPKTVLQSAFQPILLDVQVDLERPYRVKNSLLEGSVTGQITVKGPPDAPIFLGNIAMTPGSKIFTRDKIFEVATATAKFNDPKELNPELYVSARTRVGDYDVNLLAQGPKKNMAIRLSSTPPLSEQDIITLLALGSTSDRLDRNATNKAQDNNSGYEVGTAIIQNTLSKPIQKTLGVDLQFSSGYDDAKNVAVQKITVSRKLSEKMQVQASRLQGDQTSAEVKLNYSLTPELSAIGSYERNLGSDQQKVNDTTTSSDSIFGIDLEFKKEFK